MITAVGLNDHAVPLRASSSQIEGAFWTAAPKVTMSCRTERESVCLYIQMPVSPPACLGCPKQPLGGHSQPLGGPIQPLRVPIQPLAGPSQPLTGLS